MAWTNWSGCQTYQNTQYHEPRTVDKLIDIVKSANKAGQRLAVAGAGHSFANLFDAEHIVSMKYFDSLKDANASKHQITCEAGMSLLDFYAHLEQHSFTLPAFPTGCETTIGGIVSTATHGSGKQYPILAEAMLSCKILTATGEIKTIHSDDPAMPAVRAGLGQLGVLLEITMQCEPVFLIRRQILIESPDSILSQYHERDEQYDSQHVFWFVGCKQAFVSLTERVESGECDPEYVDLNNPAFEKDMHEKVAWTLRFPQITRHINTKMFNRHVKSEDFIAKAPRAFLSFPQYKLVNSEWGVAPGRFNGLVADIVAKEKGGQAFQGFIEIRSVAADSAYLSHCYKRDEITFGNTVFGDFKEPPKVLRKYSEVLQAHGARPHLAKACTFNRKFESLFPGFADFEAIRKEWDPKGIFKQQW